MDDIETGKKSKDVTFADFTEKTDSSLFNYYAKPEDKSRPSSADSQLPPLFVEFRSQKGLADPFHAKSETELLNRIFGNKSLFGEKSVPAEKPLSGENPNITLTKAESPKENTEKPKEPIEKPKETSEPKGPVKLDQVKFNTDDVAKAFQIAKENNLPVIVYKGADFCHNCPPVSRAIDGLADKIKNSPNTEAVVIKLNWERQQELQKQNPELAKMIEQLMPANNSSFPDVKVYNPRDLSKPLKDANGYGGDAEYLQSLIKVGKDAIAKDRPDSGKTDSDKNPVPKVEPKRVPKQEQNLEPKKDNRVEPLVPKAGEFKLGDGTYKTDASGRVSETRSADGSLKREFKYEDPQDPNKITSYTLNDKAEFKRISGNAFSVSNIDSQGNKTAAGIWQGQMDMGKNGVFSFKQEQETILHRRGASSADLSSDELAQRKDLFTLSDTRRPNTDPTDNTAKPAPVKVDNRPSDSRPSDRPEAKVRPEDLPDVQITNFDGKSVKLEDGSYRRDDSGRVVEMLSADGKTKRSFKYDDAANPNRITSETINDKTTYKFIGNCKIGGEPYKIDGKEVNSYSIYDEKGSLTGNWSGVRSVSPNGVYAFKDDSLQKIEYRDASGNNLSDKDRDAREKDGIWPAQIDITRDDGTSIHARLNGTKLESLTETIKENGKERELEWKKDGDKWLSNETPARERKNLSISADGTIRYESVDGSLKHEQFKNGTRAEITKDGIRRSYDKQDQLSEIKQVNGDTRSLKYEAGQLSSIVDKTADKERSWSRKAGSDEWTDGSKTETRKELKVNSDASISFKNSDGLSVSENCDLSRITSDDKNRPLKVEYPSGSSRTFEYKNDKLLSVSDTLKSLDKDKTTTWTRQGDSNNFSSTDASGKIKTRQDFEAKTNGDYSYKTADGKDHKARAYDLERQSRGEIVVGSESMQEARDRFMDAAKENGLKTDRLEKYFNQLEDASKRYGTKAEQISKAVDNLSDILEAKNSPLYSKDELLKIVETGMHNIANPTEIDQGYHPTCNVTTTEVYAAARFPERYTDLLKQIALSGTYQTAFGSTVTPPKNALKPGRDENAYDLDKPNIDKRNLASQIYEMTAVNGVYELGKHSSQKDGKDNGTRYVMGEVRKQQIPNGYVDLGEDLLVDKNGKPKTGRNGQPVDGPEFIQDDVITASEMITGGKMPYIEAPYKLENEANWHFDLPNSARLLKAKQDGLFPMGVPTIRGAHVQTIHDVTVDGAGKTWVLLDNQHGIEKDGWVTLEDLHRTQTQDIQLDPKLKPWQRPDGTKQR